MNRALATFHENYAYIPFNESYCRLEELVVQRIEADSKSTAYYLECEALLIKVYLAGGFLPRPPPLFKIRFTGNKIYVLLSIGGVAEAPWAPKKWPPSLQICRIISRPCETVSVSIATYLSLRHSISRPHILVSNKKY